MGCSGAQDGAYGPGLVSLRSLEREIKSEDTHLVKLVLRDKTLESRLSRFLVSFQILSQTFSADQEGPVGSAFQQGQGEGRGMKTYN